MTSLDLGPRYEYLRELGAGGMGRVVLVRDERLGKEVALKLLQAAPANQDAIEQFQKEFALLAEIEYPGIARAYDFGYIGDRPFFTSEYVEGETLARRSPPPDVSTLLSIARRIAEALTFLHRSGILHLDVKPSNIVLPLGSGRPVLIDFGLFRRGFASQSGAALQGSMPYMAPECFRGESPGPWTDVYSFGVTMYRVAAGRFPRPGASSGQGGDEVGLDPAPRPPSAFVPSLPADLDRILLKCLALDPRSRFQDAGELLRALEATAGGGATAPHAKGAVSRTVGREAELAAASRFLAEVPAGKGPAVLFVTGPSGIGQTHFLREVKVRVQMEGMRFYLETGYPGRLVPPGSLLEPFTAHVARAARPRWEAFLSRLRKPRRPQRSETSDEERRLRWAAEVAMAADTICEPVILAVDALERFDEVSVALACDLARHLGARKTGGRPPIGIVAAYREEGPAAPWLRDLTEQVLGTGAGSVLPLKPLGPAETLELYRLRGGRETEASRGLGVFQATQGLPAKIVALAAGPSSEVREAQGTPVSAPRGVAAHPGAPLSLDAGERRTVWTLILLGRPVSTSELSAFTGVSRGRLLRILSRTKEAGLVVEEDSLERPGWLPGPRAGEVAGMRPVELRRTHRRIAERLCRRLSGSDDPRRAEAVHHFRAAGSHAMAVKYALPLARYLKATYQSRAALEVLNYVTAALPRGRVDRLEALLELVELQARVGELDEGIRLLGEVLSGPLRLPRSWRARVLLRLATLYSRRGDFRRADSLFREGLAAAHHVSVRLSREELLFFLNEHAAMKAFAGEHEQAKEISERGLRLAGRGRSTRLREAALNLHATRGSIALRELHFDDAGRSFETALEIAEAVGSLASKAVILNNLGIAHSQSDRYGEAIRAFQEAEETCLRIDEGPSLAFIHGNLAVLHAKTGEFDAMEKALSEAGRLSRRMTGRRQELFLEHHVGLALLYRGRFAAARPRLEKAIRLGEAIGDRLVTAFDEVYRAECLIFEGAYSEASRELRRILDAGGPGRVRAMARARLFFCRALTSPSDDQEKGPDNTPAADSAAGKGPSVPFLDAWDALYRGWALSIGGAPARAMEIVAPAQRFFLQHGLHPAGALAAWILAEAHFLSGEPERARDLLESSSGGSSGLLAVLWPLLAARLCVEERLAPASQARCADLLAEAGAGLVGNPLPEWAVRVEALREWAEGSAGRGGISSTIARRRKELARELPASVRRGYLSHMHWKTWTAVRESGSNTFRTAPHHASKGKPSLDHDAPRNDAPETTVSLRRAGSGSLRAELVALSPGMRALTAALDRLRDTELPVVVSGETGAGKELVARIVHAESRRFAGSFLVVDCATIPGPLLEVELFGARAGAFTDLQHDREGILTRASGGTVLVDEVAGASLEAQSKLLRVLSEKTVRPVGAESPLSIDVRFIFSTSRDLERETREGRFRRDLLHRIQVLTVRVPPLRERPEDLSRLTELFLKDGKGPAPRLGHGVLEKLRAMPWPGNVRELKNLLSRLRLEETREITTASLGPRGTEEPHSAVFPRNLLAQESLASLKDRLERDYIDHHLKRLGGDTTALSRLLGVTRKHLYRRCRQLGIRLRGEHRNDGE